MSNIYFYTSAMSSGKTGMAITTAYNYLERNLKPLVIKPMVDTRDGDEATLQARSGAIWDKCYALPKATNEDPTNGIYDLEISILGCDVVIIDEVQFLSVEQIAKIQQITERVKIPLICYGLRNNFQGGGFPASDWLLRHAGSVTILKGMCHCGKKATHNLMVKDGKAYYGQEGESAVFVGGNETYHAVCFKHFKQGKF